MKCEQCDNLATFMIEYEASVFKVDKDGMCDTGEADVKELGTVHCCDNHANVGRLLAYIDIKKINNEVSK